ncbi:MAG TPA: hypothetical protein VN721_12680 [Flavipsychrobacter sp.]|nr:hypothetical protein [Flavipsychrobacter sp.]
MKKILLACFLLAGIINANAQTSSDAAVASTNKNNDRSSNISSNEARMDDPFNNTSISVKNKMIKFRNLPETKSITAYLSNSEGEIYIEKQVSSENPDIDISDYPGSGLHYLTLITDNKKKKVFIVHL